MVCIYCAHETAVSNSRLQKRQNSVWRRRRCTACGTLFTTIEAADLTSGLVVQYSPSKLLPFSRDKLWLSIYKSMKQRSTGLDDATAITATVIAKLTPSITDGTILPADISHTVRSVLQRFDKPSQAVYAAYHPK